MRSADRRVAWCVSWVRGRVNVQSAGVVRSGLEAGGSPKSRMMGKLEFMNSASTSGKNITHFSHLEGLLAFPWDRPDPTRVSNAFRDRIGLWIASET